LFVPLKSRDFSGTIKRMIVMQETVTIPADRGLFLKLPEYVPPGKATITVSVTETVESGVPAVHKVLEETQSPSLEDLKQQAAEKTARRKAGGKNPFEGLYGVFKDSKTFAGDPVEIVKKWREEWLVDR
jgi:hypothetical protein